MLSFNHTSPLKQGIIIETSGNVFTMDRSFLSIKGQLEINIINIPDCYFSNMSAP